MSSQTTRTKSHASLSEVNASVDTASRKGRWGKLLAFLGPAYLVSVGYMDPGNWATDIAGGSRYGYSLIWVLLMSNLIALLLQSLSARLGVVRGLDLAQASRETYPQPVNLFLYFLAEIAIAACDLAEVIGMAIGLQLLFHIPLLWGVCITILDSFLLLFLLNYGIRKMEAFIIALVSIIGMAFFVEMLLVKPNPAELITGFVPSLPDETALYIAIGIIGATVMPHNLYLHSSLVQSRRFERNDKEIRKAIRYNIFDSAIALNLAFFVNAAILVLAASAFYKNGLFDVTEIQDAHRFLEPLLGTQLAPVLFAVALIASGQSSTITGTLAGQIVMEGYLNLRIQPWIRRLLTRSIAIIPAFATIYLFGEESTGSLLVLSQVILSLQLGFAIIPLIHFVSDKKKMGSFTIGNLIKIPAWICAFIIVGLNVRLVVQEIAGWIAASDNPALIWTTVVPLAGGAGLMLLYIALIPFIKMIAGTGTVLPHGQLPELTFESQKKYKRIAVAVDFSAADTNTIRHAVTQGGTEAEYCLIHVVETAGALMMGSDINDLETGSDRISLGQYLSKLQAEGYRASSKLGHGNPKKIIPELVKEYNAELLVMGAHGHGMIKDMILGTTVEAVRHKVEIPVLVVSGKKGDH